MSAGVGSARRAFGSRNTVGRLEHEGDCTTRASGPRSGAKRRAGRLEHEVARSDAKRTKHEEREGAGRLRGFAGDPVRHAGLRAAEPMRRRGGNNGCAANAGETFGPRSREATRGTFGTRRREATRSARSTKNAKAPGGLAGSRVTRCAIRACGPPSRCGGGAWSTKTRRRRTARASGSRDPAWAEGRGFGTRSVRAGRAPRRTTVERDGVWSAKVAKRGERHESARRNRVVRGSRAPGQMSNSTLVSFSLRSQSRCASSGSVAQGRTPVGLRLSADTAADMSQSSQ